MKKTFKSIVASVMAIATVFIGSVSSLANAAQPSYFYADAKWYDLRDSYTSYYVKTTTPTSAFLYGIYTTSGCPLIYAYADYNWFVEEGNYPMYTDHFNMYYTLTTGSGTGSTYCIAYYPSAYSGAGKLQLTHVYKR